MRACRRCGGMRWILPEMSPETLAAYNAIGGCLDHKPCPECARTEGRGALSLAPELGGELALAVDELGRLTEI